MKLTEKIPWLMGRRQRTLLPCLEQCCAAPSSQHVRLIDTGRFKSVNIFNAAFIPAETVVIVESITVPYNVCIGGLAIFLTLTQLERPDNRQGLAHVYLIIAVAITADVYIDTSSCENL